MTTERAEQDTTGGQPLARLLAFYLPQFHPIPENDAWWGPGFTEWTNVASARPLFRGHLQPNIPADLGFYDLRLPETRAAQADLAERHGVEAFCYWHYWFAGKRLLQRPFDEVLASGAPRLPFCLAWANENWSALWTGEPDRILIEQTYPGPDDYERHFHAVLPAFCDPRYLRVDGRPLFVVYRPAQLPDARAFVEQWRTLAAANGLSGLYLVGERKGGWRASDDGFDADTYPPIWDLPPRQPFPGRIGAKLDRMTHRGPRTAAYRTLATPSRPASALPHPELPTVISNWDNTPRLGRHGLVLTGATPDLFGTAVKHAVEAVQGLPAPQRIVFVKSWNEWAEGNYIEPDRRFGTQYLEALRRAATVAE